MAMSKRSIQFGFPFLLMVVAAAPAMAQQDTTLLMPDKHIDELVVRAEQRKNTFSKHTRIVSTITREQLRVTPVQSIADVLKLAPGVDIRSRGAAGVQADVSVRGGSFDQVMILLNGVNVTDPQTGHHNLNLPVDIASVERIEILQGPGARSFGPNAFSGAINFITTSPSKGQTKVRLVAGDFGYFAVGGETAVQRGDVGIFVSANHQQSDGYMANTDFAINNFYGSFTYGGKRVGKLELSAGVQDKGFGANSFYSVKYPNQYEATRAYFGTARWERDFGAFNLTATGYWRRHFDRFELFRFDPLPFYKNHNYHRTDVYGANLKSSIFSVLGKTLVGGEVREESILSNVLGNPLHKPIKITGTNLHYTNGISRTNISAFIDHSYSIGNLFLSVGAMLNYANDFGASWYWGGDASYLFGNSGFRSYVSANQSYRLPTFTDLFYKSAVHDGNPSLKPERAMTYEVGLKYERSQMFAQAAIYHRVARNSIDIVKLPTDDKTTVRNLTELRTTGVELNATYALGAKLLRSVSGSFTYQLQDKNSSDYISMYVLDYLRYKATLSATVPIYRDLSLSLSGMLQDRAGAYTSRSGEEVAYSPFFTLDAKLMYTRGWFTAFAEASNLLDKHYYDIGNIEQPGRWFKAGVELTF